MALNHINEILESYLPYFKSHAILKQLRYNFSQYAII